MYLSLTFMITVRF